jgi:hypothetical protein
MTRTPDSRDVIAVRVMQEQEWAFDQRARHISYREMRRRVNLSRAGGGLGYDLSEHALKGLVNGYMERMRETLEESPDFYRTRELADLEDQYRAAAAMAEAVDEAGTMLAAYADGYDNVAEYLEANPGGAVLRDEKVRLAALAQLRSIGERRAKLLGLDAATAHKVDVTVTTALDAAVAELEAELSATDA